VAVAAKVADNDARVAPALAAATSWARNTLGRAVDDPLTDLTDYNAGAITGYAADAVRHGDLQAALMAGNIDVSAIPFDLGRRWERQLCAGTKHTWALA